MQIPQPNRSCLVLLLSLLPACAGAPDAPAAPPVEWEQVKECAAGGRTAAIGLHDRALHLLDAAQGDLAPPIPNVAVVVKDGPYLRYVLRTELGPNARPIHLIDWEFRPVTELSNVTEVGHADWNSGLLAFGGDGALWLMNSKSEQPQIVPGCWRAMRDISYREAREAMWVLDRRDSALSDLLVVDYQGPARIASRNVVTIERMVIEGDKLPPGTPSSVLTDGACRVLLVERQEGEQVVWSTYEWGYFTTELYQAPSKEAAIAQVEAMLVKAATGARLAEEAERRRAAELLAANVANATKLLDLGEQHADHYRAAVAAGDLEQARVQAAAVHSKIGSLRVPAGDATTATMERRLRQLYAVPLDWSARRPEATLDTIVKWLPVTLTSADNPFFWQRVEQLVLSAAEVPSNESWRVLTAIANSHLSSSAQQRLRAWQGGREVVQARAACEEAVNKQDWQGALSKAASIGIEDWCGVLLRAPFYAATPDLFAYALQQVGQGPLHDQLAIRRDQSVEWQAYAANSAGQQPAGNPGTYTTPGSGMTDSLNDLNRRMYEGNLRRYGLPRNY